MAEAGDQIRQTEARKTVQVHLADGRVFEADRGTRLVAFFKAAYPDREDVPVAGIAQDELRELAWPVEGDVEVTPIFLSESDGMRIYTRSLSFLLIVATYELFPDARLYVDYSVPYGGYFCRVEGRAAFSAEELGRIKEHMRKMVAQDLPIVRHRVSAAEAEAVFSARGEDDKLHLLEDVGEDHIHLYSLKGFLDYFYGYMVPSTGGLRHFTLELFAGGFILRFPRREAPTKLLPSQRFTGLREVFSEYGKWLDVVGVRDVSSLNEAIRTQRMEGVVLVSEALHEQRIAEIAGALAERYDATHRLVFIAGPSSSGKTTFSRRLAVQLIANELHPYPLGMDDYFRPRSELSPDGKPIDFDSLEALDTEFFEKQLHALLDGEEVTLPHYNFHTGEREDGATVTLDPNQIIIVEGIHGLNPQIIKGFPRHGAYRIFISALTQLNLDSHNRIPTTDTRLIRRIARDAVFRGYTAQTTLSMWENVRQGEKQNIFPYQEHADVMFNSALVYELAVLKPLVQPLLLQVKETRARIEAERLLAFLSWFDPYPCDTIPRNSILREFVGGSALREFIPKFVPRRRRG